MKRRSRFRQFLTLILCLALLLPCAPSSAAEKTDALLSVDGLHEPFYAADTLPAGIIPGRKSVPVLLHGSAGGTETAVKAQIGWYSDDFTAEEMASFLEFRDGNIIVRCERLRTPGFALCSISAESERFTGSLDFTFQVIDFSDDPLPGTDEQVFMYTTPGRLPDADKLLSGYTRIPDTYESAAIIPVTDGVTLNGASASVTGPSTERLFVRVDKYGCSAYIGFTVYSGLSDLEKKGTDEPVTVSSFSELQYAVMDLCSNRIVISPGFSYGKPESNEIRIGHGRSVTISPENGLNSAVINGSVCLSGNASVIFSGVTIQGTEGDYALKAEKQMSVTIGSVRGADSSAGNGGTAVYVSDGARVKVGDAVGGSSVSGLGGDGVIAVSNAGAEVGFAAGGSSAQGVGGAGVIAMAGSQVTVTGEAAGGNGGAAPGRGILPGLEGYVTAMGSVRDGEKTETGKKTNPDVISSYALLQNALRNGKTEIVLAPQFSWNPGSLVPLFTVSGETVRIAAPDAKRPVKMKNARFLLCCGSWELGAFEVTNATDFPPLYACGKASVAWSGSVSSSRSKCVHAVGQSSVRFSGNANGSHSKSVTVMAEDQASVELSGNVTSKGENAVMIHGGASLSLRGNVTMNGQTDFPAVYMRGGRLALSGNVTAGGGAVECHDSDAEIDGTLTGRSKDYYVLYVENGTVSVTGTINGKYPYFSTSSGHLFINGLERTDPFTDPP